MATTDININPRTEELKTEFSNMIWKMATNLVHGGKVNPVQFMDYTWAVSSTDSFPRTSPTTATS